MAKLLVGEVGVVEGHSERNPGNIGGGQLGVGETGLIDGQTCPLYGGD